MSNAVLLIAHAPLAHALRECALHVFPDCGGGVAALDVQPNVPPEESLAQARILLEQLGTASTLVLTDVFGATPCNVAQRLCEVDRVRLLAGVNLPMLLRAVSYRAESLDAMAQRALAGGVQGVMPVASAAPQNQSRKVPHDQDRHDHHQ